MGRLNTFLCCHGRLWHAKSSVVDPYLFTSLDPDYFFSIHKVEYIVSEPFLTLMYFKLAYSQGKETLLHPPPPLKNPEFDKT